MKWFMLLFSFYILALSGMPCSAQDGCCVEEKNATACADADAGHRAGEEDHSPICPCSPFFACGACHGAVIPAVHFEFLAEVFAPAPEYSLLTPSNIIHFPSTIWQPPKQV